MDHRGLDRLPLAAVPEHVLVRCEVYGSLPLYAPASGDGTFLLKPGQEGYLVLGEAFAAVHYRQYAYLKGGRQVVNQGYINPSDIRMTPYTFEGVTVAGERDGVRYLAGYLWKVKPWNSDEFISMAEKAGADGSHAGVGMIGLQLAPLPRLRVDVSNQLGFDTFNTVYVKGDYRHSLNDDWHVGLGAEFTDQRAVGDALVTNAATRKWRTRVGAARAQGRSPWSLANRRRGRCPRSQRPGSRVLPWSSRCGPSRPPYR